MNKNILFILLLISLLLISGCAKVAKEKGPIKIAINVWPGYAHAFIAQEKGFFEKNDVDVELILKKDYSEAQKLYNNKDVEGIFEVYTDTILSNSEGTLKKLVYIADYSDTGDVIIGKPEFNSLVDLVGKKIGIEGVNSFSHLFVLTSLEKAGLKETDTEFENIPAHDVLTALEEGRIDAGHTWEPTKSDALEKGYKILSKAGDNPGIITDVLAFNSNIIKERPDEIQAIVKSLIEARNFVYSNKEEALEIMSKAEGMSKEEIEGGINGVHHLDLKENIEAMKKSKKITSLYTSGKIIVEFYLNRGQLSSIPNLGEIIEHRFVDNIMQKEENI